MAKHIFLRLSNCFFALIFTTLLSGPAHAVLSVDLEITPDPAEPGEVLNVELTVTNSDEVERTGVILQMEYPDGLGRLSTSLISDGGSCGGGDCLAQRLLTWELEPLPAGRGITVSLPPAVDNETLAGSVIEFAAEVRDNSGFEAAASETVEVVSDRVLELALSESTDPVAPGDALTYVLSFGHSASSTVAEAVSLQLPVPAGLEFVSASDGGALVGNSVQWDLDTLESGETGERRVTFDVDPAVVLGTVVKAEAALEDDSGQVSRAEAVTRVEDESPLTVAIEASPNPAQPGEVLAIEITVTNTSDSERSEVSLELRYPDGLDQRLSTSLISDGGSCSGGGDCLAQRLLTWELEPLPAGRGITVSLPPAVDNETLAGSVIEFAAEARDSSGFEAAASETVGVVSDRVLELALSESADPVAPGDALTYVLSFGHSASSTVAEAVVLQMPVPAGLAFVSASDGGALVGDTVQWDLGTLESGETGERRVTFDVDPAVVLGTVVRAEATLEDDSGQVSRADAVTRVEDESPLSVAIEASPNPAQPGEVLAIEITVTNTSDSERSGVSLELRYPDGLDQRLSTSLISDGGSCSDGGDCLAQRLLTWELELLPAGRGITVSLPPAVDNETLAGSVIEFVAEVRDSSGFEAAASETVEVVSDRVLELALSESADPVAPGDALTYVLSFGHSASSTVAEAVSLQLSVPAGLAFVSASDGGALVGDTVQWDLDTLGPGETGERRVTFDVDPAVRLGTVVKAEATLEDDSGQVSRAAAVTRVEDESPLTVAIEASPNPAQPGELLAIEITVTNTSDLERSGVMLQLRYPDGLGRLSTLSISDDGSCGGGDCLAQRLLTWELELLPAGADTTVRLPPVVDGTIAPGSLFEFVAEAEDSSGFNAAANEVVRIGGPEVIDSDSDNDGAPDDTDNCLRIANSDQRDTDGDGFGNRCDTDLNNDGITNILDLGLLKVVLDTDDADADFDGDGTVGTGDLDIMQTFFLLPPGPSAQVM